MKPPSSADSKIAGYSLGAAVARVVETAVVDEQGNEDRHDVRDEPQNERDVLHFGHGSAPLRLYQFTPYSGFFSSASSTTSSMAFTKWIFISPICSLLRSSRTLTSFSNGMITSRTPLRLAASTFSLMPPTGSTCPLSVISPVMGRLVPTRRSVSMESSAAAIVMPAEGPSLGIAPAGTCTWMSLVLNSLGSMPYLVALPRTHVSAACTDSCITGPSCPVMIRPLLPPGMRPASIKRTSPPTGVHPSPTATPARRVRSATSVSVR